MKMKDLFASRPFMEIIDILSYYMNIKMPFKPGKPRMTRIGNAPFKLPPALIIEPQHQFTVFKPGIIGCNLSYIILFP